MGSEHRAGAGAGAHWCSLTSTHAPTGVWITPALVAALTESAVFVANHRPLPTYWPGRAHGRPERSGF
jgi:hypothetical protein